MLLKFPSHPDLKRIVVLNPKGGSGKSTVATNLAGFMVSRGYPVALMDFDPQGSAMRWLQNRPDERPPIHGLAAFENDNSATRSYRLQIPQDIRHLIVDTPAAIKSHDLIEFTRGAHAIIVPVLPSDIDIHAASRLIADMLVVAKVSRRMGRLGVIANRVRDNTVGYRKLKLFLDRLSIVVTGQLRDSQAYVHAADQGLSIHEMQPSRVAKDIATWGPILDWLEERLGTGLTARDLYCPEPDADVPAEATAPDADDGVKFRALGGVVTSLASRRND
ncbi:MAG: AAA family ATPase [Gammaproteobacteria bacterium]